MSMKVSPGNFHNVNINLGHENCYQPPHKVNIQRKQCRLQVAPWKAQM